MNKGAKFSDCGNYRYQLWRIWDESRPLVQLIGLNPSTANAETDDPTIRRITTLVAQNGYGGFYMTNIFAFISSNPDALLEVDDPQGDNDLWLKATRVLVKDIVLCYGSFKQVEYLVQPQFHHKLFEGALCFGKNKNGSPKHPLYLKSNTKFIPFNSETLK